MDTRFHISVSPHIRGPLTTRSVMTEMLLALLPTTVIGVWVHGVYALAIILTSILAAVLTESLFNRVTKRKDSIHDLSAVVTGLLLALTLPGQVPLYIPVLGAVFAILVVKCLFGGLGHNIMNPALAGRCFLLISFGAAMTGYTVDGVTTATPLAELAAGNSVDLITLAVGQTSGVIGSSALGLIAGGIYLLLSGGITWEIPVSMIGSTFVFMGLFGGEGFDLTYLLPHTLGGGLLMAAFFMATDPVTCPSTSLGQLAFGAVAGILCGLLRVLGAAADSTTYAILLADLIGPIIDDVVIPKPFAYRSQEKKQFSLPKPVTTLVVIVLIAGLALSGVFAMTKETIAENKLLASAAAFKVVLPQAETFAAEENLTQAVEALEGAPYAPAFKNSYIDSVVTAQAADGSTVGYILQVSSTDCYEDRLSLVVGLTTDGTVNAIAFTDLHETPGMGMLCGEPAFMDQFAGVNVPAFTLVKSGGGGEGSVDSVSGASTTSQAVVNAVNAALDFYANHIA